MKRSTKIFLVLAVLFIVLGAVIFTVGIASLGFDFSKLSTEKTVTATYEIDTHFDNIVIDVNTADVKFGVAEDGKCKVVCRETDKVKYNAEVSINVLTITDKDTRKWYDYIGVNFVGMEITVYLPDVRESLETDYTSLSINTNTGDIELPQSTIIESINAKSDTGDICISSNYSLSHVDLITGTGDIILSDFSAGEMKIESGTGEIEVSSGKSVGDIVIETDTGAITLSDLKCDNLEAESDTGDILLRRVMVERTLNIISDTGDVTFDHSDAKWIFVETDTGDVEGTLASEKVFVTKTSTGDVSVPKSISGGNCEIITDTGDIEIEIK